ncbi:MAG: hypothetical protein WED06_00710 [Candidatus Paceibacterota bacterium]
MNQILSQALLYLSDFSQALQKYAGDLSLSGQILPKLSYSWLILLFLIFAVFIIGLGFGKSRILLSLMGIYPAALIKANFVYFDWLRDTLSSVPEAWLHVGVFLIFYVVMLVILNRSFLKKRFTLREASFGWVLVAAIVGIGFLSSIIMTYLPSSIDLPSDFIKYFATKNAQFWWAVAPIIVLVFAKSKKDD